MKRDWRVGAVLGGIIAVALALSTLEPTPTHAQQVQLVEGELNWKAVNRFNCTVVNNAATILTAFGGSCVAPGAGLRLYITDISASSSVVATTTADNYLELKTGTGGTCGTATAVIWANYNLAFQPVDTHLTTPIPVAINNELCWMHAATGSKTFIVDGYIAP